MARAHKSGPRDVQASAKGDSPTRTVPGGPGHSFAQRPMPGPTNKGQPIAMQRALKKKSPRGTATGAAGLLR